MIPAVETVSVRPARAVPEIVGSPVAGSLPWVTLMVIV